MGGEHHNYPFNPETGKGFTEVQLALLDKIINTPHRNVGFDLLSEIEVKFPTVNFGVGSWSGKLLYDFESDSGISAIAEATLGQSLAKFVKEFPTLIISSVSQKPLS
jgi:hypothetical protein